MSCGIISSTSTGGTNLMFEKKYIPYLKKPAVIITGAALVILAFSEPKNSTPARGFTNGWPDMRGEKVSQKEALQAGTVEVRRNSVCPNTTQTNKGDTKKWN